MANSWSDRDDLIIKIASPEVAAEKLGRKLEADPDSSSQCPARGRFLQLFGGGT